MSKAFLELAIQWFESFQVSQAVHDSENFFLKRQKCPPIAGFLQRQKSPRGRLSNFGADIPESLYASKREFPFFGDSIRRLKNKSTAWRVGSGFRFNPAAHMQQYDGHSRSMICEKNKDGHCDENHPGRSNI